jgi:type IV fimbrial biogenesis protein FimT
LVGGGDGGPDRSRGFTLIELIIALTFGAIILVAAIPAFVTLLDRNEIGSASDQLYASLATARSEAVKRRGAVRVCPSSDSNSCRGDGIWSDGWLVFADADGNGQPDTTADIIRAVPSTSLANGVDLDCDNTVDDGVTFAATGTAWLNSGAFRICHSNSNARSREISIAAGGRIAYTTRERTDCNSS